jgi:hypothetical protein
MTGGLISNLGNLETGIQIHAYQNEWFASKEVQNNLYIKRICGIGGWGLKKFYIGEFYQNMSKRLISIKLRQ